MNELKPIDLVEPAGRTDVSGFFGGESFDEIFECLSKDEAIELQKRLNNENN